MFQVSILPLSLAWEAVQFTLKGGFICPFMVIDPTGLGATY